MKWINSIRYGELGTFLFISRQILCGQIRFIDVIFVNIEKTYEILMLANTGKI